LEVIKVKMVNKQTLSKYGTWWGNQGRRYTKQKRERVDMDTRGALMEIYRRM
jgi:hypothetical protein